ncbi:MAG: glycosyltransferase [Actinobacteria bacterium]|uniref:Unannotated protein n=1 Tax=freshwater metagenome TaxID=449393 RepID=A0A6J7JSF6_9ZZZZ|nr:glycosyltransferase [Actinomycetota bacterium]
MRIAQVANFYGPSSGGIRTLMHHLGAGYVAAGHESFLIVPGDRYERLDTPYGCVITLPSSLIPGSGGYRAILDVDRVCTALDEIAPDRVEVSDRLTLRSLGWWARAHGIPSLMWAHERVDGVLDAWLPGRWPTRRMADSWNRSTARRFDRVVCSTRYAAEEFERIGCGTVARVALGVDLAMFHPTRRDEQLRRALLGDDSGSLIVMCSRLSREKRPELAIRAVQALAADGLRTRLVVLGTGPLEQRLRSLAVGIPVTFLGHISERERMADILASADALIAPGPIETFGLAALEGLASGTAVVASAPSALSEIVTTRSGRLVAGTVESFSQALREVLSMPVVERSQAARDRACEFPWSRTVESMLTLHGLTDLPALDHG